jgi:hypothetical protein
MAEKIVSPGVFTQERDLSFLPQGISEIGAAIIGPTKKGPAFIPTLCESFADFEEKFGGHDLNTYVPLTVSNYLDSAGRVTVVRVLGIGGYKVTAPAIIKAKNVDNVLTIAAVLHPTKENADSSLAATVIESGQAISGSSLFILELNGSGIAEAKYSASVDPSSDYYLTKIFGEDPQGDKEVYVYSHFESSWSGSNSHAGDFTITTSGDELNFLGDDSSNASTPYVISQTLGALNHNLFRCHTLSHGDSANKSVKVGISNIKAAGSVAGSDYGSFTVIVRKVKPYYGSLDTDRQPEILETYEGCTLDPNNAKYVTRVIGDQYQTIDAAGKVYMNGDYASRSKYIRIEPSAGVKNGTLSPTAVPFGHAAYSSPIGGTEEGNTPSASFVRSQDLDSTFSSKVFHGFDFVSKDNYKNYLKPLPDATGAGNNTKLLLSDISGHPSSSYTAALGLTSSTPLTHRKFIMAFQGGFDGMNPATPRSMESDIAAGNVQGFDLTNSQSSGSVAYKKAINSVSNPDAYDINMMATPGLLYTLHPGTITHAKNTCEDRGDAFYVFDPSGLAATVSNATGAVEAVDTNYAATYYPWVKVNDVSANKHRWVPPSVVLPGVLAFNDKVAYEWYAPAGLNRGGLSQVLQAYTNLTHAERDDLYEGRVNPIASFPGQGVVVWGQKTLQGLPSALDRINVRRLLIALKKFIASATKYLVFEQNSIATRNRFLGIVNPYLETVQSRQGLSAFKVVMDDSNNTPDIIDRNILFGQIFLQPTRTAEFIVLDFNIMPTGAAFPE